MRNKPHEVPTTASPILNPGVAEFATVAAEFCRFVEQAEGMSRKRFTDTMLKLLPLLYLKAAMLPPYEQTDDLSLETYVTEETYEVVRLNLADIMRDWDDYLDVFVADMAYSDQPIAQHISEGLADIYQDVKDFAFVCSLGIDATTADAVAICRDNFARYWGQTLTNVLRALHRVRYTEGEEEEEGGEQ